MPKDKTARKKLANPLDTFSKKRGRGRPYKIRASEVSGRAYNYHLIFSQVWDVAGEQLVRATTEEEIIKALEQTSQKAEFVQSPANTESVARPRVSKTGQKSPDQFFGGFARCQGCGNTSNFA